MPGGLPGRGDSPCQGGFSLPGDPPVNRITHTCKNITLATTSLRPVIIMFGIQWELPLIDEPPVMLQYLKFG